MKDQLNSEQYNTLCEYEIDAYTLFDLLSILPKKVTDRQYIYTLEIGVWNTAEDGWYIKYVNDMDNDPLESYQEAEELIDAIYDMIVFLKDKDNANLVWL